MKSNENPTLIPALLGSILGNVALVGVKVLAQSIANGKAGEDGPYMMGDVAWSAMDANVLAFNTNTEEEVGVSYALSRSPTEAVSVFQPIPHRMGYLAGKDIKDFGEGQMSIATVRADAPGNLGRAVSFAIRTLAVGAFVNVVQGFDVKVEKDKFTIRSTGAPLGFKWDATIADGTGTTVSVSGEARPSASGAADPVEWVWTLPAGLDLDTVVEQLDLRLELPTAVYEAATAERRKLAIEVPAAR